MNAHLNQNPIDIGKLVEKVVSGVSADDVITEASNTIHSVLFTDKKDYTAFKNDWKHVKDMIVKDYGQRRTGSWHLDLSTAALLSEIGNNWSTALQGDYESISIA